MDMDQLRRQFPDEQACQQFFEAVRWQKEPMCPHYSRGMIHCNTAESFASLLECGRVGVFHLPFAGIAESRRFKRPAKAKRKW